MASSYILPLVFVILQLVSASHAFTDDVGDANRTFTIMNYLPKDDFATMECDCLDVEGNVTILSDSLGTCVDKWYPAAKCPSGVEARNFFCHFRYYVRDRVALTIAPKFTNILVWTSGGPVNTFYQLTPSAVYGSTDFGSFGSLPTNKLNKISDCKYRLFRYHSDSF